MGKSTTNIKEKEVSSGTAVAFEVTSGKKARSELIGTKGKLTCVVTHEAYLSGTVACHYQPTYKGHYFHHLPVNKIVDAKKRTFE